MNHKAILVLACLTLAALVHGAAAIQSFDCLPGFVQNISPQDMGALQTVYVYNGSLIQLDGSPWRDAVSGRVPPVGWPGSSTANATNGSHLLKISLKGFQDFEAHVNICKQGATQVEVHQVSLESTTALPGANRSVSSTTPAGKIPVPSTTNVPGFELITAISAIACLFVVRKDSFR